MGKEAHKEMRRVCWQTGEKKKPEPMIDLEDKGKKASRERRLARIKVLKKEGGPFHKEETRQISLPILKEKKRRPTPGWGEEQRPDTKKRTIQKEKRRT